MVDTIHYRQFEPADTEACRALVLQCIDQFTGVDPEAQPKLREKVRHAHYREELPKFYCVVAVADDRIVGMGAMDNGHVARMYVSPEHQGHGIGRRIHEMLEAEARRQGIRQLTLEASLNSVAFYEHLGYKSVQERIWRLEGAQIRNVIMTKDLE